MSSRLRPTASAALLLPLLFFFTACANEKASEVASAPTPLLEPTGRFAAFTDLRYAAAEGASPDEQSLDLVLPRALADAVVARSAATRTASEPARDLGRRPVIVFVHGGTWSGGDKRQLLGMKTPRLLEAGFLLASVNHRLAPAAKHPAQVEDVASALAWLHEHAPEYGGASDRFVLLGHSSGAHLVALVATDPRWLAQHGLPLSLIAGVASLDGAGYDLTTRAEGESAGKERLETVFGPDPAAWRDASPIEHVIAADGSPQPGLPPFLLFHAGDRAIAEEETKAFAAKLAAAGARADVVHVPDRNHITIHYLFGAPDDAVTSRFLEFAQEVTR